jgi:hypothetical protein
MRLKDRQDSGQDDPLRARLAQQAAPALARAICAFSRSASSGFISFQDEITVLHRRLNIRTNSSVLHVR